MQPGREVDIAAWTTYPLPTLSEVVGSAMQSEAAASADLLPVLHSVAERITLHRGANIGEQNTKLTLINPVLRAIGWNVEDLDEVRHEFRRVPADKPVDYALMLARTPRLFVEAKALDENLDDRKWANQIISYATVAGVEWVLLTNGDEYRIYNSHAVMPVEDKLFRNIRISANPEAATEALLLLSKEHIKKNALNGLWRAYSIDRRVREAVEELFLPEPSQWLVRRLANGLEGLTQGDVKGALARARVVFDFPAREQPILEPPPVTPVLDVPRKSAKNRRRPCPKEVSSVTVQQLIEARFIEPPLELQTRYKGHDLVGRVEPDGRVVFDDETYNSVSVAAAMARRSVIGAPPGRRYPQTNGWTFWRFRDNDGQLRELSVLRERYAAGAGRST